MSNCLKSHAAAQNILEYTHEWNPINVTSVVNILLIKETKSATMNIFRFFYFLFKSFVKVELSHVFTINMFTIAENCTVK